MRIVVEPTINKVPIPWTIQRHGTRLSEKKSLLRNADNKGRLNDQITTRRYGTAPHNFKRDAEACVPNDMKIMQQRT
jgi:hypothetical protein